MNKLKARYLFKEIDSRMIANIEFNNLKNIELNVPVKIDYKTYKKGDNIHGELYSNDNYKDERVFVISYDIICEILNTNILDKIKSKNHVRVRLINIKSSNGCFYFLAQGNIVI